MRDKLRQIYARNFTTIRAKLIAFVSLIIIISVLLFTGISLDMFQTNMTEMVKLNNGNNAKMLSDKIEGELRNTAEQLRLLSSLSHKGAAVEKAYFLPEKDFFLIANYVSLDEEPTAVYALEKKLERFGLQRTTLLSYLKFSADDAKEIRTGKFIIRALSSPRQRIWLLVVPVKKQGTQAVAAIMNGNSLAALLAAVRTKGVTTSLYDAMLVDADKKLVAHSDSHHFQFGQDVSKYPIVEIAFKNFTKQVLTGVQRYTYNGVSEYGSYRKLGLGSAGIITTVNEDVALAGVRWARLLTIIIALLTIAVAFLFIYFFSRTISDPLKKLVRATQTIRSGDYDVHLEKASDDETGELTQAFNEMAVGLKEREKLKGAFGKFVNKEVANMVMKGDLALGGETKTVTVFFSDIRSFTSISEKLSPEEVVGFLNEYMTLMVDIVYKYNGVVDKFIGDAIMALWGAPVAKDNDVENAILAALEMRQALHKFNEKRGSKNKPIIRIGMGINTGEVLAGQIGSNDRLEYTVIGDAVNLASRMEGLNKVFGTDILISENTYKLVREKFSCVQMQKVKVKGKTDAQRVYAVLGKTKDSTAPKSLAELHKRIDFYPQKGKRK
ncbi:MAG: hypothetical protein LDLANPLL_01169 [Turneriella sp.]|nr:hypothetical protein [Turneriella sp.]